MKKGKVTFTRDAYEQLRNLIFQREKANSSQQKRIRAKLRTLGLYWSEVAPGMDYTVDNFDGLFKSGVLRLSENNKEIGCKTIEKDNSLESIKTGLTLQPIEIENIDLDGLEQKLIYGDFISAMDLEQGNEIPEVPGIYCIKIKKDVVFPKDFGKIRADGIIYIGIASTSLKQRLWEQELNHRSPATFFRSIGAMLGYLPIKGSLAGKTSRNYKFASIDTEEIRKWMKQSLLVNFISVKVPKNEMEIIEKQLIKRYSPLVNIEHNDNKSQALIKAREKCVQWAKMEY